MIVTDARGKTYRLTFEYESVIDRRRAVVRRGARAYLIPLRSLQQPTHVDQSTRTLLSGAVVGTSLCSVDDDFVRAAGRERALERCLEAFAEIAGAENAEHVRACWADRRRGSLDAAETF